MPFYLLTGHYGPEFVASFYEFVQSLAKFLLGCNKVCSVVAVNYLRFSTYTDEPGEAQQEFFQTESI
jgi:hypothetical protein